MSEEEKIFIKELENKLNVTDYNKLIKIIKKYIDTAEYNKAEYEKKGKILESQNKEITELYEKIEGKDKLNKFISNKYNKSLSDVVELEYKLDKENKNTKKLQERIADLESQLFEAEEYLNQ